ncbi:MAG: DUF4432 family protein [Actinobacteria bacterium]|nr:DUF4432 family protein [Actinomycetota bacterium]
MLYSHFRNYGCRINTDYFYKNLRVAILENEYLKISILIDKGTDIFEFLYKPKDTDFMWLSPWGIKSPSNFVSTIPSKDGNFMDYYEGGWQEIIPNFGISAQSQGTEQGLHGEISLIPWDYQILENSTSSVSIKFMVRSYRTPLYVEKILTLKSDDPKLYISERLINEGYADVDLMWTHHPTFGGAFLDDNVIIDLPKNKVKYVEYPDNVGKYAEIEDAEVKWPSFKGYSGKIIDFSKSPTIEDENQSIDEACLQLLDSSWYAVTNIEKKVGFGMSWDKNIFPYLWIWRVYGKGCKTAPWWGRVSCMALEICSSFSPTGLTGAVGNKTAIRMKPRQEISTSFIASAYENYSSINGIDTRGNIY